jgi:hypothetical protein
MNEKIIPAWSACIIVLFFGILFGCAGARPATDGAFIYGARSAQRFEDAFFELAGTVERASRRLDDIRVTAGSIQDASIRLGFIINEYDTELYRLRAQVASLRAQVGDINEYNDSTGFDFSVGDNP